MFLFGFKNAVEAIENWCVGRLRLSDHFLTDKFRICTSEGDQSERILACSAIIEKDGSDAVAYYYRAQAYAGSSQHAGYAEKSISDYTKAIENFRSEELPTNRLLQTDVRYHETFRPFLDAFWEQLVNVYIADSFLSRGGKNYAVGDTTAAVRDFSAVINLETGTYFTTQAHNNRGFARANSDSPDWGGALSDLDKAISLDPRFSMPLVVRASIYIKHGEIARAMADIHTALNISQSNPAAAEAFFLRGLIMLEWNRREDAATDFFRASQLGLAEAGRELKRIRGN